MATETAGDLLREAGWIAGREFCLNVMDRQRSLGAFMAQLQIKLKELSIGVLRVEKADSDNLVFTLTISEDLDCSGLPFAGTTVCDYDEGFISGLLYAYSGKPFIVKEVDCWATGDRTLSFRRQTRPTRRVNEADRRYLVAAASRIEKLLAVRGVAPLRPQGLSRNCRFWRKLRPLAGGDGGISPLRDHSR